MKNRFIRVLHQQFNTGSSAGMLLFWLGALSSTIWKNSVLVREVHFWLYTVILEFAELLSFLLKNSFSILVIYIMVRIATNALVNHWRMWENMHRLEELFQELEKELNNAEKKLNVDSSEPRNQVPTANG
ncbi:unnamed protein product [Nezara viridula]|uniref:Uncharacterized protein n=1 Tax=Nezara viridula TaxID=85310 RepID=A0A9P0HTL3_NEZVI|nr:unnamed protein product [Nezara viridula]